MSGLDHIFLYCLMFALAIVYDKQYRLTLYKSSTSIRPNILPLISDSLAIVFIITEGLRYGRGVDQIGNYGPLYLHCMSPNLINHDMEQLFILLNQTIYKIDITRDFLPFGIIFIIYAAIFWFCLWHLYRNYSKISKCFLLFAIFATNYITEWTIRQGVSYSFILLGLHFLHRKRWKSVIICVILSFGIHHGNIISILLIGCCYTFLYKKPLSWKISVPVFVVLELFIQSTSVVNIVQNVLSHVDLTGFSGGYSSYVDNNVFERETSLAADWERGALTQILTILFYSALLVFGNLTCKINSKVIFIYNVFVIGILLYEPFRLSGTFSRLFLSASTLWFIPISIGLYHYKDMLSKFKISRVCFLLIIFYLLLYNGRYVFLNPDAKYVWNL